MATRMSPCSRHRAPHLLQQSSSHGWAGPAPPGFAQRRPAAATAPALSHPLPLDRAGQVAGPVNHAHSPGAGAAQLPSPRRNGSPMPVGPASPPAGLAAATAAPGPARARTRVRSAWGSPARARGVPEAAATGPLARRHGLSRPGPRWIHGLRSRSESARVTPEAESLRNLGPRARRVPGPPCRGAQGPRRQHPAHGERGSSSAARLAGAREASESLVASSHVVPSHVTPSHYTGHGGTTWPRTALGGCIWRTAVQLPPCAPVWRFAWAEP
jgi:hypothetical protein